MMNNNSCKEEIVCIGEVLWDALPNGLFLGGAPLNVAFHLRNFGEKAVIASRVGNDRLGVEAMHRIENKDICTDLIQQDIELETGFVDVELDEGGHPRYDIIEPAAWDRIELSDSLMNRIDESGWGIVFGSLAQRSKISRDTIQQLFRHQCLKIFDVNLRPPFDSKKIIEYSLGHTDILKLNKNELDTLTRWFNLPEALEEAILRISIDFDIPIIALSCGGTGSALLYHNEWFEQTAYKIKVADSVGAGDAFLAAFLHGIKQGEPGDKILALANAAGAYVASQNGAVPVYDQTIIRHMLGNESPEKI